MHVLFITFQLLLLLLALPLLMLSTRTSRSQRSTHAGFCAAASLVALLAGMLTLASLSALAGEEEVDAGLMLIPPVLTMAACAWIVRRALQAQSRPRSTRRGSRSTRAPADDDDGPLDPSVPAADALPPG
jgi:hypothetical protein